MTFKTILMAGAAGLLLASAAGAASALETTRPGEATVQEDLKISVSDDTRTIFVPELNASLTIFPGVFRPVLAFDTPIHAYVSSQKPASMKRVLDIASGSGVLGLIALKSGALEVVSTDISSQAVRNSSHNAAALGFSGRYHPRLVPEDKPEAFSVIGRDERFDLITLNPPTEEGEVRDVRDRVIYDPGFTLLRSFVTGLKPHLKKGGRAVITCFSSKSPVAAWELVRKLAPASGLEVKVLVERSVPGTRCRLYLLELTPAKRR